MTDGHGRESWKTLPGQGQQSQGTPGRAKIPLPHHLVREEAAESRAPPEARAPVALPPAPTLQQEGRGRGSLASSPCEGHPPPPRAVKPHRRRGQRPRGKGECRSSSLRRGRGGGGSGLRRRGKGRAGRALLTVATIRTLL